MEYRTLGRTGLKVSLAAFGTGGPSQFGQHKGLEQGQQTALVRRCLELGVNLFDTHEGYGGSERILGEALHGVPRDSYHLVTKWSYHSNGGVGRDAAAFEASVERSLNRLRTDYVDVMMIHGPLADEYDSVVERFVPTLERLQEQGKVRFKGFSTRYIADPAQEIVPAVIRSHPVLWDVVMLKYGILNQIMAKRGAAPCERLRHWSAEHGIRSDQATCACPAGRAHCRMEGQGIHLTRQPACQRSPRLAGEPRC